MGDLYGRGKCGTGKETFAAKRLWLRQTAKCGATQEAQRFSCEPFHDARGGGIPAARSRAACDKRVRRGSGAHADFAVRPRMGYGRHLRHSAALPVRLAHHLQSRHQQDFVGASDLDGDACGNRHRRSLRGGRGRLHHGARRTSRRGDYGACEEGVEESPRAFADAGSENPKRQGGNDRARRDRARRCTAHPARRTDSRGRHDSRRRDFR